MIQINQVIMCYYYIMLCVGIVQQDYDFYMKVLLLKSVKKMFIYDGMVLFYYLYYGNDFGEESMLIICFFVVYFGCKGYCGFGQIGGLVLLVFELVILFWEWWFVVYGFDVCWLECFGEQVLLFVYLCGILYELIGIVDDECKFYLNGEVLVEFVICGLYMIGVNVWDMEVLQEFMQQGWLVYEVDKDGKFLCYVFGDGGFGKFVDYVLELDMLQVSWIYGEGIVYYCVFQVVDCLVQDCVKVNFEGFGFIDMLECKDCGYFELIYVCILSGVMFEVIVLKLDVFLIDELYEKMGQMV